MTKEYRVTTEKIGENEKFINLHYLVDYAEQLDLSDNHALMLQDDRVVLKPGVLEGYYESPVYRANPFKSLVGSWAAISGEKATVELKVRVRVDGTWSSYLTYSSFGLGSVSYTHLSIISIPETNVHEQKKFPARSRF